MKQLNNPFVVYGYKGAEYFCDREKETETIINGLENERNITLLAPRRIGKTGLIHHVFERIRQGHPECYCFYVDIFSTRNLDQFVQLLAQSILGQLDTPSQAALHRVSDLFSSLRPTLSFDSITGVPTFSVNIAPGEGEHSLRQIFEYLGQSGKRCYVAIDEFQQITEYPESGTEALLRSYIQFLPNVYFIFAGSQQHLMTEMFLSAKRPFYQSSQMVELSEIPEPIYYSFASRLMQRRALTIDEEVFSLLYQAFDGQTWYLQSVLNRLYATADGEITRKDVEFAVMELVEEQTTAFENYYSSLTNNQSALLQAIAKERHVKSPMAQGFIHKYHLPAQSSVKMAVKALVERQLIYLYRGEYVVYDRFFALWLLGVATA